MSRLIAVSKLTDVARAAGVSNATASRALNGGKNVSDDARKRIMAAAQELSYSPNRAAQSLKGRASGMIGMIVPTISDDFFANCARAVEGVARDHGALLVVLSAHDRSNLFVGGLQQLLLHNIDGIILGFSQYLSTELIAELSNIRVPVVGIDAPLTRAGLPSVLCENFQGALLATEHLIAHGYQTIVSLQVKPNLYTIRERHQGYRAAMQKAGREPVHDVITDRASALQFLEKHLSGAGPLAVFASNNLAAQLLYGAARLMKLTIPRQLAIIAFDDFDLADTLTPPMSVVRQPVQEIGRAAAKLLFQQIPYENNQTRQGIALETSLAPQLILRQSCGCNDPEEKLTAELAVSNK